MLPVSFRESRPKVRVVHTKHKGEDRMNLNHRFDVY